MPFRITVTDPEDGTIDCAKVKMTYVLGHDSHGHQITSQTGCTGTITIPVDGEHDAAANIFGVFDAEYTDEGGLTTHTQHITAAAAPAGRALRRPRPASRCSTRPPPRAATVGYIENGDWIAFTPYKLGNATAFTARVSSGGAGGTLEVRAGSATGTLLGTATVPVTGGWETFADVTGTLSATRRPAPPRCTWSSRAARARCSTWTRSPSPPAPPTGAHRARSRASGGQCLDVDGAATADGAQVQLLARCNGSAARRGRSTGARRAAGRLGKCLDVAGGGTADGTAVPAVDLQRQRRPELDRRRPTAPLATRRRASASTLRRQLRRQHRDTTVDLHRRTNQKWTLR